MNKAELAALLVLGALGALTVFHLVHYALFCRFKAVPGKSHCAVCGHRRACRKYHSRKASRPDGGAGQ